MGISKTTIICRGHDICIENPKVFTKIVLELNNKFSKATGCKNNIQMSVAFLYNNNELSEKSFKNSI